MYDLSQVIFWLLVSQSDLTKLSLELFWILFNSKYGIRYKSCLSFEYNTKYAFFKTANGAITLPDGQLVNVLVVYAVIACNAVYLNFAKPSSSTDTTFQLVTYPNAQIFSTANTASSLYSFYNGALSITVNNRQIVPSLDLYRFYNVPQQQSVANAYYTTSAIAFKDQQDGSSSALYPIEPGIVFSGSKQNIVSINIPASLAAIETNSRVVLYFAGHLAQNVTSVR